MSKPREGSTNWGEREASKSSGSPREGLTPGVENQVPNGKGIAKSEKLSGLHRHPTGRDEIRWVGDLFRRRSIADDLDWARALTRPKQFFSVCGICENACGIMAEVTGGLVRKLDGSPYHPATAVPHARYSTSVALGRSWPQPHPLCEKGSRGLHQLYDPFRVSAPLKRTGPRGSGRWQVISWAQLVKEVVAGGRLFPDVDGEEERRLEGFADLFDRGRGKHDLLDPLNPGLGPKTNQLVVCYNESEAGRHHLLARFAESFGTVNLRRQESRNSRAKGSLRLTRADLSNCRYLIRFGGQGSQATTPSESRKLEAAIASGRLTSISVMSKNDRGSQNQVAVNHGTEHALAWAMILWLVENGAYDSRCLSLPGRLAAARAKSPNFSNASWLYISDRSHPGYGGLLDPSLAALDNSANGSKGYGAVVVDPRSRKVMKAEHASSGELWPTGELSTKSVSVNGIACCTGFQLLYRDASAHTFSEWAEVAGVTPDEIARLSLEFSRHGRFAVAEVDPSFPDPDASLARAVAALNQLAGNIDWLGGSSAGAGGADLLGSSKNCPYPLGSWPAKRIKQTTRGRASVEASQSSERLSVCSDGFVQGGSIPSPGGAGQSSQHRAKIVIQHKGRARSASVPIGINGAEEWRQAITDLAAVPLLIAIDTVLSETAAYADYVVPDTSYLESWGFPESRLIPPTKTQGVRHPIVEPLTSRTSSGKHASMEQFLIDVANEIGLSGFGKGAFSGGEPLEVQEDYYLKMLANVAYDEGFMCWRSGTLEPSGAVPNAEPEELKVIGELRASHPDSLTSSQWRKAAYVLARGGRFENYEAAYLPSADAQEAVNRSVRELVITVPESQAPNSAGWMSAEEVFELYADAVSFPGSAHINASWMAHRHSEEPCLVDFEGSLAVADQVSKSSSTDVISNTLHRKEQVMANAEAGPTYLGTLGSVLPGEVAKENIIELCREDAERLGFSHSDWLLVWPTAFSPREARVARLRLSSFVEPGIVKLTWGFWASASQSHPLDNYGGCSEGFKLGPLGSKKAGFGEKARGLTESSDDVQDLGETLPNATAQVEEVH